MSRVTHAELGTLDALHLNKLLRKICVFKKSKCRDYCVTYFLYSDDLFALKR